MGNLKTFQTIINRYRTVTLQYVTKKKKKSERNHMQEHFRNRGKSVSRKKGGDLNYKYVK